jgi:hypothetical protein
MRSVHIEEGIRNYDNCVECHRSPDKDTMERKGQQGEGEDRGKGEEEGGDGDGD